MIKNIFHGMTVVDPKKIPWTRIAKGVFLKNLAIDKKKGYTLSLFKFYKNTKLIPHKHASCEWMYVLDGIYQDEYFTVPKGMLKINRKGTIHTSRSTKGCTLLVLWNGKHIPLKT